VYTTTKEDSFKELKRERWQSSILESSLWDLAVQWAGSEALAIIQKGNVEGLISMSEYPEKEKGVDLTCILDIKKDRLGDWIWG
jgi:hypothetical protein